MQIVNFHIPYHIQPFSIISAAASITNRRAVDSMGSGSIHPNFVSSDHVDPSLNRTVPTYTFI
jgi:hypothetical protein